MLCWLTKQVIAVLSSSWRQSDKVIIEIQHIILWTFCEEFSAVFQDEKNHSNYIPGGGGGGGGKVEISKSNCEGEGRSSKGLPQRSGEVGVSKW